MALTGAAPRGRGAARAEEEALSTAESAMFYAVVGVKEGGTKGGKERRKVGGGGGRDRRTRGTFDVGRVGKGGGLGGWGSWYREYEGEWLPASI